MNIVVCGTIPAHCALACFHRWRVANPSVEQQAATRPGEGVVGPRISCSHFFISAVVSFVIFANAASGAISPRIIALMTSRCWRQICTVLWPG